MKRRPPAPGRQRGVALIVSLLVVAIVTALALLFTARQQLWMRQIENRNNFTMAIGVAVAAIDMGRLTLRDDARRTTSDNLLEPWTIPIPPIAVEEGKVAGRITELQGRYNLTNLLPAQGVSLREDDAGVARVARALELSPGELVRVLREFQSLRQREPEGTPELAELLRIAALPAESQGRFQQMLAVLPEKAPLNVNFASAEALQATVAGLTAGDAAALVAQRTGNPFKTLNEFTQALPAGVRGGIATDALTVQSRYFLMDIDAWFNEMHTAYQALLLRDGTRLPTLLWARRSKLGPS
ncbi:MAG: type II secretion system minor pseudopilin GspK [Candidatus Dactylopiibacterium sp.]|nr:type II secretion system minor pseudopilin GspK [Candidatus Dactylopiibacterium sp.]